MVTGLAGTSRISNAGALPTDYSVLDHLTCIRRPGGAAMISPRQMCCEGSNWPCEAGARLLCQSIAKNLKCQGDLHGWPQGPKLVVRAYRHSNSGRVGRCLRGGVCMVMSAALRSEVTGKLSSTSRASPSYLWRNLTPEM